MFLPGERREVTMLNSDIAGFSTLSQSMQAEELVDFLNNYFARMIEVVLEHGGKIDKFQGDGMLVVFGAPNPMVDHAARRSRPPAYGQRDRPLNRELVEAGRPADLGGNRSRHRPGRGGARGIGSQARVHLDRGSR